MGRHAWRPAIPRAGLEGGPGAGLEGGPGAGLEGGPAEEKPARRPAWIG